ncbi:HAD hydrolase-like protein [Sphaerisporangium sp. NBC_01403]|uniref:HAD family hydrolase n=1 Tax=Sphaerisporangium sp. NBC_01403 TaxID=2903599 RepID=UPI00324FCE3B
MTSLPICRPTLRLLSSPASGGGEPPGRTHPARRSRTGSRQTTAQGPIFEIAAQRCGVTLNRGGWMIEDNPTADVAGGRAAGLCTIWIERGKWLYESSVRVEVMVRALASGASGEHRFRSCRPDQNTREPPRRSASHCWQKPRMQRGGSTMRLWSSTRTATIPTLPLSRRCLG